MDWENKHFKQESVFAAPVDSMREAARRFANTTIPDWSFQETPDGFTAIGRSGFHHAEAHVRFTSIDKGTAVAIELLVRRSSGFGYMLVDIGGYYEGLIRKWIWALWRDVSGAQNDPQGRSPLVTPRNANEPDSKKDSRVFVMDASGKPSLGVVRDVGPQGVLVAYDEGDEKWVPAAAAHVVNRRGDA